MTMDVRIVMAKRAAFSSDFVWNCTVIFTAAWPNTNWHAFHTFAHHTVSWSPHIIVPVNMFTYSAGQNITSFCVIRKAHRAAFTLHLYTV
jgi:hypothetical protein